ncbi:MAG: M56 family metallopeptidase [Acidobacteriota bacterium]|nr:M56 family metallopeptidase [Acidobacteriota bacterium]
MDLNVILRTSLLLAAAAIIARLLRHAAPSTRHLLWHCSIVLVLLAPALGPLAPTFQVPMVPTVPQVPMGLVPKGLVPMVPEVPRVPNGMVPDAASASTPGTTPFGTLGTLGTLGTVLVLVWYLLCWLASGLAVWRGSRPAPSEWVAEARAVAARLRMREPSLRRSRYDGSPHVAGLFRSVVMMPPQAALWTTEARQAALVHEFTHIRRRDRLTQALAQLACAVYWFNPLVWHAAAALGRERERACDDEVLRLGARPSEYATLLLDLARKPAPQWLPATALSMARRSAIEDRLLMILADAVKTPRRSSRWLVTAGIAALATAILGAQPAVPAPAAKPESKPKVADIFDVDSNQTLPSLTSMFVRALGDASGQVREQAALALALTPGDAVIDPLLVALKDPDAQVREKAAIGLAVPARPAHH